MEWLRRLQKCFFKAAFEECVKKQNALLIPLGCSALFSFSESAPCVSLVHPLGAGKSMTPRIRRQSGIPVEVSIRGDVRSHSLEGHFARNQQSMTDYMIQKSLKQRVNFFSWRLLAVCFLATALPGYAGAMLKHLERVSPRIAQRGTTVEVSIRGAHLDDPREIIFDRPGIRAVSIEPMTKLPETAALMHGGRMDQEVKCRFEIAPDCALGEHRFRLRTATQLSSLATFHVSPFPTVEEKEDNDTIAKAQEVPLNVTVRGRVGGGARGDADVYKVPAKAGARLSVELDCVRLADVHYGDSEFDLALRLLDASGREIAANDENPLHSQDPLLSVKLPVGTADHVFVEVRRSVFAAGDVAYALHIGEFERPLAVYPPGGPLGQKVSVRLLGDPLGERQTAIDIPAEPGDFEYLGDAPSALRLRSFAGPNVLEQPGDKETRVERLPAALNGILAKNGEEDCFRVSVRKGERYRVRVLASGLGSPLDPALSIRKADAETAEITADDADLKLPDRGSLDIFDPTVIWEPKADGEYLLQIRANEGAGPTGVYRIEVDTPPDVVFAQLRSVAFDAAETGRYTSLAVPQHNRWIFNLSLPTGLGTLFKGDMEVFAKGLPKGVSLANTRIPGGTAIWPVELVAGPDSEPGGGVVMFGVRAVDSAVSLQTASVQRIPFINHSGGNNWRSVWLDRFIMAVTDASPFSIEVEAPSIPLVRGGELAIPVKIRRHPGFTEPISLKADFGPGGVALPPAETVPGDASEAVLRVSASGSANLGSGPLSVIGTTLRESNSYLGTGEIRVAARTVYLKVAEPYVNLRSDPASVRRSGSAQYRWTISAKSAFEGVAVVNLLGLPKGVTVREPLPRVSAEATEVIFQIQASDEALLGPVSGLECEVMLHVAGQEIRQRTGKGNLRIDPKL